MRSGLRNWTLVFTLLEVKVHQIMVLAVGLEAVSRHMRMMDDWIERRVMLRFQHHYNSTSLADCVPFHDEALHESGDHAIDSVRAGRGPEGGVRFPL